YGIGHLVATSHGNQIGFEAAAEDAPAGVTRGTGQRAPAQRAVDMDMTIGKHLRALTHRRRNYQIAAASVNLLAGTHWLRYQSGRRLAGGFIGMSRRVFITLALAAIATCRLTTIIIPVGGSASSGRRRHQPQARSLRSLCRLPV